MKKKALSDTLIKRIAGTLPSGRVLLKGRRSRSAWLGSIKEMMKDYKGMGGGENLQAKQDIGNRLVYHAEGITAFDI